MGSSSGEGSRYIPSSLRRVGAGRGVPIPQRHAIIDPRRSPTSPGRPQPRMTTADSTHVDFVFHPDFDAATARSACESAAAHWAEQSGRPVQTSDTADVGVAVQITRWQQAGPPAIAMDLTLDSSVPVSMCSIVGRDAHAAARVAEWVWDHLTNDFEYVFLCHPDELIAMALDAGAEPADLIRAAIPFKHDPQATLAPRIESALDVASGSDWQAAGAKAAALAAWPTLVPALEAARAAARDDTLRRLLDVALLACRPKAS